MIDLSLMPEQWPASRRTAGLLALVALSFLILGISTTSALADLPSLSPLTLLPGDATLGPAAGDQTTPAVARGADLYLCAWEDDRGNSSDIYAARLDAGGNPIDTIPLVLAQAPGTHDNPRVAWNGSNWLVTWESQDPTQFYYASAVRAVRVSPQGQILDPEPLVVLAYQNSSSLIYGLASDGTDWAVVVEGTSAGEAAIRGVRIAPDGTIMDPGGVVVVPETYYLRFGLELGGNPGEYLLVWNEWRSGTSDDILAYRLTPALQKMEANPFVVTSRSLYENHAKVASNGTDFFVAWDLNDNYLSSDVYGTRVSSGGQILDPNGKAFSNAGPGYGRDPAVTWDGVNWIASWGNYGSGGLNAGRMTPQGVLLEPGGVSMPALGWGGIAGTATGGFTAVWSDATGGSQDVYGAPVSGALAPGTKVVASLGAPRQTQPALAFSGNGYLAVFLSARSDGSRVMGQRLDAFGTALDAEPFEIQGPPGDYTSPGVAWNGALYLVTWVSQGQIHARRVAPDGSVIDPNPVFVQNGQESSVAALNDLFLVVGNYAPSNPEFVYVFGTRIRGGDGVKLDNSPLSIGGSFSRHPKVATVGGRWMAAWQQHPTHDDPHCSCLSAFIDSDGSVSAPFGVGGAAAYNFTPVMAAKGDTALVVWSDSRVSFNNLNVYARRVLAGGTVLDGAGFAVSTAPNTQTAPAVASDGAQFLALFQDARNIPVFFDEHLDVYGARVTTQGTVLDPSGFALADDPAVMEFQPAAAGGGGGALLGCSAYRWEAPYAAFRIGLRFSSNPSDPAGVAADAPVLPAHLVALPNPATGAVAFRLPGVEKNTPVQLSVFDVEGREVARIHDGMIASEGASFVWNRRDESGRTVPPGAYFVRLRRPAGGEVLKVVLR